MHGLSVTLLHSPSFGNQAQSSAPCNASSLHPCACNVCNVCFDARWQRVSITGADLAFQVAWGPSSSWGVPLHPPQPLQLALPLQLPASAVGVQSAGEPEAAANMQQQQQQ